MIDVLSSSITDLDGVSAALFPTDNQSKNKETDSDSLINIPSSSHLHSLSLSLGSVTDRESVGHSAGRVLLKWSSGTPARPGFDPAWTVSEGQQTTTVRPAMWLTREVHDQSAILSLLLWRNTEICEDWF